MNYTVKLGSDVTKFHKDWLRLSKVDREDYTYRHTDSNMIS
jgi:hypothetical protein